jgi:hypothetical protein
MSKPASQQASRAASQPASQPGSQPASKPARQPASEPASQLAAKESPNQPSTSPPSSQPLRKPTSQRNQAANQWAKRVSLERNKPPHQQLEHCTTMNDDSNDPQTIIEVTTRITLMEHNCNDKKTKKSIKQKTKNGHVNNKKYIR